MDTNHYIRKVLTEHLLDGKWYAKQAKAKLETSSQDMWELISNYMKGGDDYDPEWNKARKFFNRRFRQRHLCCVPQFYGVPKVHKKGILTLLLLWDHNNRQANIGPFPQLLPTPAVQVKWPGQEHRETG